MKKQLLLISLTALSLSCFAQKSALEWDDVQQWNRITSQLISDDGNYVVTQVEPWVGDSSVAIYSSEGELLKEFACADAPKMVSGNIVVATLSTPKVTLDSMKLAKAKKMPMNRLAIYNIAKGEELIIDSLNDVKTSSENAEWVAYRTGKGKKLTITDFGKTSEEFDQISEYRFSENDPYLIFSRFAKDSLSQIVIFDLAQGKVASTIELEKSQKGERLSVGKDGQAAYIVVGEDKSGSENQIFYWNGAASTPIEISSIEKDWIVNENFTPRFAENKDRLFFGISPQYPVADTTILESNKPKVDVWIWNEPKLKTQQIVDYNQDIRKSYSVVYNTATAELSQITSLELPDSQLFSQSGDSDYAIVQTSIPYGVETMWTGERRSDIYIKNIVSGETKELFKGENVSVRVSPDEKYLYWYQTCDSTWNAYSIADERFITLVRPDEIEVYDSSRNVPSLPVAFGSAGWSEGDELFYIYDKYDIWAIDPSGKQSAKRITDGYKNDITYRVVTLDREKKSFESKEKLLLKAFNNKSKQSGYASMSLNKPNVIRTLAMGEYRYGTPIKAKKSNTIIFTRENFQEFPNLYVADIDFKRSERVLTDVNPQQADFLWGSVEPITWISLDGDTLQGNLFKPENFDPNKQYPMICNFYERDSDNLYAYRTPEVHRSSIDYHYYTSNGYVIFNPDIKYVDGYPGESCYNSLMPGVSKILEMGFVDPASIGAQGHSWGGYQTAYLATRTNMFAALESGAPVVNMVSAYGGIRWASGLNRAFQYEKGQSRIGASPWETPSRYTENSPIYFMDKVNTPVLIMHNDHDGHVPWWQGIEFFVALRRLEKPAWMLNYNDEPHWPTTAPNKFDFQTKMSQFFDHYLKGAEMPEWMKQ